MTLYREQLPRFVSAALATLAGGWLAGCSAPPPAQTVADHWPMFGRYCSECHNDNDLAANLSFEKLHSTDVTSKPEIFEKVVRKLRSGLMPPPGSPRPDAKEREQLIVGLERYLDASAAERGPHRRCIA